MANAALFPRVHAMVLCDEIRRGSGDPNTFDLLGVRTQIEAPDFPYKHPLLRVYMQVSGRQGSARCHLAVQQADTDTPLYGSGDKEIALQGPLSIVSVVWRIKDCVFPRPGLYYVQAYFGTKLLNERLLILTDRGGMSNGRRTA
jgi:hypothetical protein